MIIQKTYDVDFCVVGGGMAGVCAAIAAARCGIKTLLMHERATLGGNASSEVRMWICGAKGKNNRETGIIEEIMLSSLHNNPYKNHYLFDVVLYEKVKAEPNLTLLLNCSCMDAKVEDNHIISVTGWQSTTQSFNTVNAKQFADCSGDSILAPLTNALFRIGREAADEYGEDVSCSVPDKKTMGISCLIQARREDSKSTFKAPSWAIHPTKEQLTYRKPMLDKTSENFWYLESGGEEDCIADTEKIRDRLIALALGFWDYVKNSGEVPDADYWKLDFLCFLPAKRESRRMCGDYIMNSCDIMSGGHFEDTVAYGGWGLDDHNPAGFFTGDPPNNNPDTPSPYGIPYRCLYSKNIDNLFFAGRNISMTHSAMSSARVMATCAILGEAVGTAAAIAVKGGLTPRQVYKTRINELQQTLMNNDCFLPGFKRNVSPVALNSELSCCGMSAKELECLRNGIDRNNTVYGEDEMGCFVPAGEKICYRLNSAEYIKNVRITFDSDLDRETLPGDKCERIHITRANVLPDSPKTHLPTTLVKTYELKGELENGETVLLKAENENILRTVNIPINKRLKSLSLTLKETWYSNNKKIHLFSFDFS